MCGVPGKIALPNPKTSETHEEVKRIIPKINDRATFLRADSLVLLASIEVAIAELLETGEIGLGKPEAPFPTERKRSGEETYGYLKLSKCPGLYYLSILTRK